MLRILVICTGNTCRSPMLEALLNAKIRQCGLAETIRVMSAGLAAAGEFPASSGARSAMAARGLNLSGHRSRQLLPEYVQASDLVLTMTGTHKRAVAGMAPGAADRIFTLAEYAGEAADVRDPFGGSDAVYESCAREIERLLEKVWEKILDLAGKTGCM